MDKILKFLYQGITVNSSVSASYSVFEQMSAETLDAISESTWKKKWGAGRIVVQVKNKLLKY